MNRENILTLYNHITKYIDAMKPFGDDEQYLQIALGWEDTLHTLATEYEIDEATYDIIFDFAHNSQIMLTDADTHETMTATSIDELISILI